MYNVNVYLDELTNKEIAAILNAHTCGFYENKSMIDDEWEPIPEITTPMSRLYCVPRDSIGTQYYADNTLDIIRVLMDEANKRGLISRPLDEMEVIPLPFADVAVKVIDHVYYKTVELSDIPERFPDRFAVIRSDQGKFQKFYSGEAV